MLLLSDKDKIGFYQALLKQLDAIKLMINDPAYTTKYCENAIIGVEKQISYINKGVLP